MKLTRRTVIAAAFVAAASSLPAFADTNVAVSLWDKGADAAMPTDLGYGMGGDMTGATMGITATPGSAAAGVVTLTATNDSKDMIHEMVLAPISTAGAPLAYDANLEKVIEDSGLHLGEVAELEPGASGSLSLTLKPGTYILYCNIPGHYMAGMWTLFEVK